MASTVRIEIDGKTYEFPVIEGSEGERAIDIEQLRGQTQVITLDPGYKNTGSCESAITFIDGENGVLRHRGYSIEELAGQATFLEVAYLLIHGELPNQKQYEVFRSGITIHTMLHEDLRDFFSAFPKDAHPMAVCSAVVAALSTFYPEDLDPNDTRQVLNSVERLISLSSVSTTQSTKSMLSDKNLKQKGFTKLVNEGGGKFRKI